MTPINTPNPPSRGGTPTNPKNYTTLSQANYVPPSATPTSDRHPVKMDQNGSPAESLNNRLQENEDFGGLFRSSLSLASGSREGAVVRALASHQCVPGSIPGPGVICGLSLLLVLVLAPRVFLRVLQFSSLPKNQHFQIPIRSGIRGPQVCQSQTVMCYPR